MAETTVTVQKKDTLMEVLRPEKDPEVKRKLSFIGIEKCNGGLNVQPRKT